MDETVALVSEAKPIAGTPPMPFAETDGGSGISTVGRMVKPEPGLTMEPTVSEPPTTAVQSEPPADAVMVAVAWVNKVPPPATTAPTGQPVRLATRRVEPSEKNVFG